MHQRFKYRSMMVAVRKNVSGALHVARDFGRRAFIEIEIMLHQRDLLPVLVDRYQNTNGDDQSNDNKQNFHTKNVGAQLRNFNRRSN